MSYNTEVILIRCDVIANPVFLYIDKRLIHKGKERQLLRNSTNNGTTAAFEGNVTSNTAVFSYIRAMK